MDGSAKTAIPDSVSAPPASLATSPSIAQPQIALASTLVAADATVKTGQAKGILPRAAIALSPIVYPLPNSWRSWRLSNHA